MNWTNYYNIFRLIFLIWTILEARVEIIKYSRSYFGRRHQNFLLKLQYIETNWILEPTRGLFYINFTCWFNGRNIFTNRFFKETKWDFILSLNCFPLSSMAVRVVEFSNMYKKLERFLPKNQHTQRIFLNFENWSLNSL